jgi:hypothetical protein
MVAWGQYYHLQTFLPNYGAQLFREKKITNYRIIHRYKNFPCYRFSFINIDNIGPRLFKGENSVTKVEQIIA